MKTNNIITAAGTSAGAQSGHGTRATGSAAELSDAAQQASAAAHSPMGGDREHAEAAALHQTASEAHAKAMFAHSKAGNKEKAAEHAKAMVAHDEACEAHGGVDPQEGAEAPDTEAVEACEQFIADIVKAGGPGSGRHKERAEEATKDATIASNRASEGLDSYKKAADAHERASAFHFKAAAHSEGKQKAHHEKESDYHNDQREVLIKEHSRLTASTVEPSDIIHCRASAGSKFSASKPWKQGEPVEFQYMPAGVHTINAGFRNGAINLTVEVRPVEDAPTCQASLQALLQDSPRQKAFGCFEHEEKQASVWATRFKPSDDGVVLEAEPSEAGAAAVNGKNHRSWSPSFTTNAEYAKCSCRKCDKGVRACECSSPSYYFPDGARGSASNPARITGVDFCVGTLTNKPAFRAIAPVKAKQAEAITAGGPGSGPHLAYGEKRDAAGAASKVAFDSSAKIPENEAEGTADQHNEAGAAHDEAAKLHRQAAFSAKGDPAAIKSHFGQAKFHGKSAQEHYDRAAVKSAPTQAASTTSELDTIIARINLIDSVDQILARIPGSVGGFAAELDAADEIFARLASGEGEKVTAGGPGSGRKPSGARQDPSEEKFHTDRAIHQIEDGKQNAVGGWERKCVAASKDSHEASAHAFKTGTREDHMFAAAAHEKAAYMQRSGDDFNHAEQALVHHDFAGRK